MVPVIMPGLALPWPHGQRVLAAVPTLWQPSMLNEPSRVINYVCVNTFDSNPLLQCWYFKHPFDVPQVLIKNNQINTLGLRQKC